MKPKAQFLWQIAVWRLSVLPITVNTKAIYAIARLKLLAIRMNDFVIVSSHLCVTLTKKNCNIVDEILGIFILTHINIVDYRWRVQLQR